MDLNVLVNTIDPFHLGGLVYLLLVTNSWNGFLPSLAQTLRPDFLKTNWERNVVTLVFNPIGTRHKVRPQVQERRVPILTQNQMLRDFDHTTFQLHR